MNSKELQVFQVAAEAAGITYKSEERGLGYVVIYNNKVYNNVRYALAAIATTILKNELKEIKD
jgi:uncharacterized membrane protein